MHLDQEQIQRVLHGECQEPDLRAVEEHLAVCDECRKAIEEAQEVEAEVFGCLGHLDHDSPEISAEEILADVGRRPARWGRWAAGIILALGATSAAYAAPGSPLRGWLDDLSELVRPGVSPVPAELLPMPTSGIAVEPGRQLSILFAERQESGRLTVRLTPTGQVAVTARNGTAAFTSDVDLLLVQNRGSGADFDIRVPEAAPRLLIRVAGVVVFSKVGGRIEAVVEADPDGTYSISLGPT